MGHGTLFSYNSNNIKKATTEIGIEIDNTQQVFKEKMTNTTLQKSSEKLKKKKVINLCLMACIKSSGISWVIDNHKLDQLTLTF